MRIRHRFTSLTLAAAAALPFTALTAVPGAAMAQTSTRSAQQTAIHDFRAQPVQRLRPGEVISFNVTGTPGARVTVTVPGAAGSVALTERQPGQYSGDYTIRRNDRLVPTALPVARIERNNQWAEMRLGTSLLAGEQAQGNQSLQGQTVANGPTQIDEFVVQAPDRLRPGDEMRFTLRGTPRGKASVAVQGLPQRVALRETSPGLYEGSHVLRRTDNWQGELAALATLVGARGVEATRRFDRQAASRDTAIGQNDGVDRRAQSNAGCLLCGRVQSVKQVDVPSDSKNILGSVAGGVIGGVLGHQVGGGSGKDLATVIGAVGGAYAGNRIQNNAGKTRVFRVTVRMDNGETQSFDYAQDPQVQTGTLVRVQDGVLHRR